MVGWHHRLNGHEFEQAPGAGDGQEAWCAPVKVKEESEKFGLKLNIQKTKIMAFVPSVQFSRSVMSDFL